MTKVRTTAAATVIALAAVAMLAACSPGGGGGGGTSSPAATPAPPAASNAVKVYMVASPGTTGVYSPDPVMVKVGQSITWVNNDVGAHTATADSTPGFDSSFLQQGAVFTSGPFTTAGSFKYHCNVHAEMKGTITVQ